MAINTNIQRHFFLPKELGYDFCSLCGHLALNAEYHFQNSADALSELDPVPSGPRMQTDRLLVEPLEVAKTVRGMSRPGANAERPQEGIVRAVGPGRVTEFGKRIPPDVAPGDLIAFPEYAGKEIVDPRGFPPGAYLIVRQDEVQINYGPADKWPTAAKEPEETHE